MKTMLPWLVASVVLLFSMAAAIIWAALEAPPPCHDTTMVDPGQCPHRLHELSREDGLWVCRCDRW